MKKKVLIFIMLLICSCIFGNAIANEQLVKNEEKVKEDYQIILVAHVRSQKYIVTDTLIGTDMIYTKKALMRYVLNKIPEKFYDTSEEYIIGTSYWTASNVIINGSIYSLYYNSFNEWNLILKKVLINK